MTVIDPFEGNDIIIGYIYLFESSDINLNPDAGEKLVNYNFKLSAGNYFDTYNFTCSEWASSVEGHIHECSDDVMNPEDSWIETPYYQRHFAENW